MVAATRYQPKKNGCSNILRQKTLTLVNFTTQFSYFPGSGGISGLLHDPGICLRNVADWLKKRNWNDVD